MGATHFTARVWAEVELDGVLVVALAEEPDGGGRTIELQREVGDLTVDGYSLTVDAAATAYGAVASWVVDGEVLVLELTSSASEAVGEGVLRVALGDEVAPDALRAALHRVLR